MSLYLGTYGEVELQRQFDGGDLRPIVTPSDLNVAQKRFSFNFDHGQLLSGDEIEITSTNGATLDFIDGFTGTGVKKFIHVDDLGGIRLYDSFADALNGGTANATALANPANSVPIRVVVANSSYKVVAQVSGFELNTERETVDATVLSDDFRNRISSLMSGSGRMSAFWEYTGNSDKELPNYLVELSLRTRVGSQFKARFYIKRANYNPPTTTETNNDEVFYEFEGVLTNCAVQFAPGASVEIQADFISTGPIQLRMNLEAPDNLVQENGDDVIL